MMQLLVLIGKDFKQLSYLAKTSILDVSEGHKRTSDISSFAKSKCWKSEYVNDEKPKLKSSDFALCKCYSAKAI